MTGLGQSGPTYGVLGAVLLGMERDGWATACWTSRVSPVLTLTLQAVMSILVHQPSYQTLKHHLSLLLPPRTSTGHLPCARHWAKVLKKMGTF